MKLIFKHLYYFIFFIFCVGCNNQPLTSTLLVGSQSSSGDTTLPGGGSGDEDGQLDIRADNQDVSAMVEDTDRIEISGTCNDLNRKKNRIIVEAFSGENENDTPYVSNAISDFCQQTTVLSGSASTGNGVAIGSECFWVTKGLGIVEDASIPLSRKSYPQCFNGRFSFAVRLGGVMQNPAPNGSRYLIRFKLRSLEGVISESQWSRVYVTRKLKVPNIDQLEQNDNLYYCGLSMSPARFNQNITYDLTRMQHGSESPAYNIPVNLLVAQNSSIITPGNSTYSYSDDITKGHGAILAGVTYTYTLKSTESTPYVEGFSYAPPLTQTAEVKTCTINPPNIAMTTPPTNAPIGIGGKGPTCFLKYDTSVRLQNPGIAQGSVTVKWAFSRSKGWTQNGEFSGTPVASTTLPTATNIVEAVCSWPIGSPSGGIGGSGCTASQADGDKLLASTPYYFAAQEVDRFNLGLFGKWSSEIECIPPAEQ